MDEIMLEPGGAKVALGMVTSCGNAGCFEAVKRLRKVTTAVPLTEVGMKDGQWLMAAFSRMLQFASEEGLAPLGTYEVARYFGGQMHIAIMERVGGNAGLGQYLGPQVGLVTHTLLPLDPDGVYRNAGHEVSFDGHTVTFNPKEPGVPCYHLGVVMNIPLSAGQVDTIKQEQAASKSFVAALSRIKGPIVPPDEYWEALNCTVKRATAK